MLLCWSWLFPGSACDERLRVPVVLGDPCGHGQTFGSTMMSSGAKRDVRAGEVQQAGIACGVPVVTVATAVRRGELLRLNHRPAGAAQDHDLLVSELCQFAHHATSRSRKAPLVTDSRARTARWRGRAWRADRPSQRPSAPALRVQGQSPIFRADFCDLPQSATAEAIGTARTPPWPGWLSPGRMSWDRSCTGCSPRRELSSCQTLVRQPGGGNGHPCLDVTIGPL